jgi:hypothetical protein
LVFFSNKRLSQKRVLKEFKMKKNWVFGMTAALVVLAAIGLAGCPTDGDDGKDTEPAPGPTANITVTGAPSGTMSLMVAVTYQDGTTTGTLAGMATPGGMTSMTAGSNTVDSLVNNGSTTVTLYENANNEFLAYANNTPGASKPAAKPATGQGVVTLTAFDLSARGSDNPTPLGIKNFLAVSFNKTTLSFNWADGVDVQGDGPTEKIAVSNVPSGAMGLMVIVTYLDGTTAGNLAGMATPGGATMGTAKVDALAGAGKATMVTLYDNEDDAFLDYANNEQGAVKPAAKSATGIGVVVLSAYTLSPAPTSLGTKMFGNIDDLPIGGGGGRLT